MHHTQMHHTNLQHTHIHQDQGSWTHASYIHASGSMIIDTCIKNQCYAASHIHTSGSVKDRGSRIIDKCIIHTAIRIQDRRYMHHTYMHQGQGSLRHVSYTQLSGSRIIDTCIIHTCIRVKDQGSQIHATYIHALYKHASESRIIDICIMDTCIKRQCYAASHKHTSGSRIKAQDS